MAGAAVRARGLVKAYGPRVAVDELDLDIRRGECFGFLGPNGAGKTTTMRMLACLSHRDAGALEVLGTDPDRDPRTLKARLGVVPQEVNLDLELSVIENMVVYGRYFGMRAADARSRAAGLLDFVGLGDRAGDTVVRLSGGMQRRLQIARALINDPAMILLDEPTTGLDPQARRLVWDRLRDLRATGTSVVLTTHYMDEAERLADTVHIIDHGRLIASGSPLELTRGGSVSTIRLVVTRPFPPGAPESLTAALGPGTSVTLLDSLSLLVTGPADASTLARVSRWCEEQGVLPESLTLGTRSLEDVFLQLTGRELEEHAS